MFKTKSRPDLEALLAEAKKHPPTEEQLQAQRLSFVRAEAGFGSDRDEAEYRAAVLAKDEAILQRLDAEAAGRVARAEAAMAKLNNL